MTDANYKDNRVLLPNTPAQAESILHRLKQAATGIGLYIDAHKTEFMYFKQKEATFTLRGKLLKLVDRFTYLGSNISSTESEINIRLAKAWKAIDRLTHGNLISPIK